jgi:hypothetical protein
MGKRITIVVSLCLLCAACSPRDFLTRRLAADLIAGSEVFKTPQQFLLRTGVVSNKDFLSPEYLVLQRRGWIAGTAVPCPEAASLPRRAQAALPPCWDVAFTPIGVETFHDLIPNSAAPSFSIYTAKRQLVAITGISRSGHLADVDFIWKWVPLNEVGAALVAGGVNLRSTVGFKHYDDGWRVLENSSVRSNQGLDDALKDAEPAP